MLPVLAGYAVTWGDQTHDFAARGHTASFEQGAFSASIAGVHQRMKGYRVLACLHHDPDTAFAAQGDGLELWEDAIGLGFRIRPWETYEGRFAVECVKRGVLKGASVSTRCMDLNTSTLADGVQLRHCRAAGLIEISLVYRGANRRTTVAIWG